MTKKLCDKIEECRAQNAKIWYKCYTQASNDISNRYNVFCVCGKLCTGLHEQGCRKFVGQYMLPQIQVSYERHTLPPMLDFGGSL